MPTQFGRDRRGQDINRSNPSQTNPFGPLLSVAQGQNPGMGANLGAQGGQQQQTTSYSPPTAPPPTSTNPPNVTAGGNYSRPSPPPDSSSGPIQQVAPPSPPPPSIGDFLAGDTGYQQQIRELNNSLQQMKSDITRRKGDIKSNYQDSQRALSDQRDDDLHDIEEDYGSRGLYRSGLYGKAVGDYEDEFNERKSNLKSKKGQALGDLSSEMQKFKSQQGLKKQKAKQQAVQRRAEKFNL